MMIDDVVLAIKSFEDEAAIDDCINVDTPRENVVVAMVTIVLMLLSVPFFLLLGDLQLFSRLQVFSIKPHVCLLYTSPSPRDGLLSRMPSSA